MLIEYIDEALRRAHYEIIDDKEPYYGEIQELTGVWATGKTLEECRENLKYVVEGWILVSLKKELPIPKLIGPKNADLTIISWGSSKGVVEEAVDKINKESKKVNYLLIKHMTPFMDIIKLIEGQSVLLVENNYSSQLGNLIRQHTGIEIDDKVVSYDGSMFTVDDIYDEIKKRI